ncbi:unnamed protein product [Sympodiomycopsis kandeliae]
MDQGGGAETGPSAVPAPGTSPHPVSTNEAGAQLEASSDQPAPSQPIAASDANTSQQPPDSTQSTGHPHESPTTVAPRTSGRTIRPTLRASGLGAPSPLTGPDALQTPTSATGPGYGLRARQSRYGGSKGKAPRLKLSLKSSIPGKSSRAGLPKTHAYMQGFEDREMDSSDEETGEGMAFEEQLILRLPQTEATSKLRDRVKKRDVGLEGSEEVSMKFKDSRRAMFKVGDTMFAAKLVDLPTMIESHKTLDHRRLFKVADISQMLLATHVIEDESEVTQDKHEPPQSEHQQQSSDLTDGGNGDNNAGFDVDEYIYPHGITPPMKWARKRRFRKRAKKKQTLETVEQEVQRLLADDKEADDTEYSMVDAAEVDMKETEQGDGSNKTGRRREETNGDGDSTMGTPYPEDGDLTSQIDDGEDRDESQMDDASVIGGDDEDDEVDLDLQAELEAALGESGSEGDAASETASAFSGGDRLGERSQSQAVSEDEDLWDDNGGDDDDDDDDDDDGDGGDDDNDDDDQNNDDNNEDEEDEQGQEEKVKADQLDAEIKEIENLIKRKQSEADQTVNTLIKKRQLDSLKKLIHEKDLKKSRLSTLNEDRKKRKEEHDNDESRQQQRDKDRDRDSHNLAAVAAQAEDEEEQDRRNGGRRNDDDGMDLDNDQQEGVDADEGEGGWDEDEDGETQEGESSQPVPRSQEQDDGEDEDGEGQDDQGEEEEEEDDLWT